MTHVLVVDDDTQNRYLLRVLLEGQGSTVDETRHGAEALLKARQRAPDLVISDLLMPVMDGYTLLRHWKADEGLRRIPFIVYTATYTDPEDERLALDLGADAFVVKPAVEQMLDCIHTVLERVREHGAAAAGSRPDDPGLFGQYSDALVRKLEVKARQLEISNAELQAALSQSRRAQAALQESEERFRATFEQAAVGIAHVGLDGRLLRVNDKLCSISGYARAELLRLNFADLALPDGKAEVEEARRAMLSGARKVYGSEHRCRRKDGDLLWVSVVSTLLRDPAGEPRYFISVVSDIHERRMLQEQFRQAQKLETIGQLTGGIAHDFNNLLTVIVGNADLLVEALAGNAELQPLAAMMRAAAGRGAELTQHLLAFARRQPLEPGVVDVNALLDGLDRLLRRMLPEDIEIEFVRAGDLWPALVDPSQLESALLNLCINARDAMPAGGRLTIATANVQIESGADGAQAEPSPGPYVTMAVSDTGTGIEPEHLARVFEPFFTTKPAGKGTGLGLSMVYGFVKQSRGHVGIHSEPGHGTRVTLYLPRASGVPGEAAVVPAPHAHDLRGSACVLLVEDDALVRRYAEQQLLSLGYRVFAAADGAAALTLLKARDDIELLFTDVIMPGGINGRQLADAARALRPGLKVLYCSGYADDALVHHGRLDEGVHLLNKPYGRNDLARKLQAALAEPAAATTPDRGAPERLLILDDDPLVGGILVLVAQKVGLEARLMTQAQEFFDQLTAWQPSHVAIDLSMPRLDGLQVLERLARQGVTARVIVCSGAGLEQMNAALERARGLGLRTAGVLAKPFSVSGLRSVLQTGAAQRA